MEEQTEMVSRLPSYRPMQGPFVWILKYPPEHHTMLYEWGRNEVKDPRVAQFNRELIKLAKYIKRRNPKSIWVKAQNRLRHYWREYAASRTTLSFDDFLCTSQSDRD